MYQGGLNETSERATRCKSIGLKNRMLKVYTMGSNRNTKHIGKYNFNYTLRHYQWVYEARSHKKLIRIICGIVIPICTTVLIEFRRNNSMETHNTSIQLTSLKTHQYFADTRSQTFPKLSSIMRSGGEVGCRIFFGLSRSYF